MTQQWHHRREDGKGFKGCIVPALHTHTHPFAHNATKHDYECRQRIMHMLVYKHMTKKTKKTQVSPTWPTSVWTNAV